MALSITQDTGLHHHWIETDKQGLNPKLCCWCSKRYVLDFTWGVKRFAKGLNSFLLEHESCIPLEELKASRSA